MLTYVGLISHLIAALAFAGLAITLLWQRRLTGTSLGSIAAILMTAIWAATFVLADSQDGGALILLSPMESLRSSAWIILIVALLRSSWSLDDRRRSSFAAAAAIGFITALQLTLDVLLTLGLVSTQSQVLVETLFVISRMTVAISGLVLIHNLYINSDPDSRSEMRLLCISLAVIFGYDLNMYTLQFLLGTPSADLINIRGAVDTLVVPVLLLASSKDWISRVRVSRQVVFHTLAFSLIGVYLIGMAIIAYGLRLVGGDWSRLLQITFIFGMIGFGLMLLLSRRLRAKLRVLIAQHFFAYKYDYRQEWLRFITTVSQTDASLGPLSERVVRAVCAVVDSPGGILYSTGSDGSFEVSAQWKFSGFSGAAAAADSKPVQYLRTQRRVIHFDELRQGKGDYGGMLPPDWAATDRQVWLAIPLIHHENLAGFIVLERSLVKQRLNWEDFELLRTLGRQSASYIAEARAQETIDESAKFDEFNRRFAFIMHDIKNLVSQLSLVARNAERHADNPAFRVDMVATIQNSVGKMNDLLARLAQHNTGKTDQPSVIDLVALLVQVVETKRQGYPQIQFDAPEHGLPIMGDAGRIEQLFTHLIQNAIDASHEQTAVNVTIIAEGECTIVSIEDFGAGMSANFIRNDLFRPFRSTKIGGFGIGAYEAREIARDHAGSLNVISREGEGSRFIIRIPLYTGTPVGGVG